MVMEKLKGGTCFVDWVSFSFSLATAVVCLFPAMLSLCSPVGNLGLERRLREYKTLRKWLDIRRWEVFGAENICELKRPGRSIHFGESSPAAHS